MEDGLILDSAISQNGKKNKPFVQIRGLTKKFGEITAVDNIDLDIYQGELFCLLGGSGCGKSTLLRMLAGFEFPESGTISIDGIDMSQVPAYERPTNMMFQSYALFPHMTVGENIAFGLQQDKISKTEISDRVIDILKLVELEGYIKRRPQQLSGGQMQRVALARALVKKPKLLLLDEPLAALDKKLRKQTQFELANIQEQVGVTFIVVTHDQEEALAVSDEIVVMHNAGVAQIGSPRDLYDTPANHFVADFIGEANIIPCEIVSVKKEVAKIDISGFIHELPSRGLSVGAAQLAVRPTRLILNAKNGMNMTVEKSTYVGSRMEYTLNAEFGKLFAVSQNVDTPLDIGQEIIVGLDPIGPVLLSND